MGTDIKKTPWKNGYWLSKKAKSRYSFVTDETVEVRPTISLDYPDMNEWNGIGTWTFGKFGPAPEDLTAITGIENFNMEMKYGKEVTKSFFGILNENGTQIHAVTNYPYPSHKPFLVLEWYSEEKMETFKHERESALAPNCPYFKSQPDQVGKLIWISGPPGAGKSTTAQLMGRNHGYIYYSFDCFNSFVNPFIDLNVENPTFATDLQTPLKASYIIKKDTMLLKDKKMWGSYTAMQNSIILKIDVYEKSCSYLSIRVDYEQNTFSII